VKLHRTLDRLLVAYPVPDEEAWRTTVSLARISTPNQARNQIPAQAEAWLDIRFPAGGSPDIAALRRAVRDQGYSAEFLRKHGSGDSRFYGERGVNSVAFGTGGAGQHGPGEYVDIATIAPYYRALKTFLRVLDKETK
jgi:succinyl-diaminopimelate desuccinylase